MTKEEILELAEKHFDYQGGWIANTEDLLKFADAIFEEGKNEGWMDAMPPDLEVN